MRKERNWFDDVKVGIVLGAIAPAIGALLYYYIHQALPDAKINDWSYRDYLQDLRRPKFLSAVLRGSLIMNLMVFILALQFDLGKIARGVIAMTIVYGLIIVLLHFS